MDGDGAQVTTQGGVAFSAAAAGRSPEQIQEELAARMKEAEAKRRAVEFRVSYREFGPRCSYRGRGV